MKRYYVSTLAALALTSSLYAENLDAYTGSIWATGANFCPVTALPANGKIVKISDYQALYSLIGITYGGDGQTTFALPNLSGRTPVGLTNGIPSSSVVVLGTKRGQVSVPLTGTNLPPHTHVPTFTPSGTTTPFAVNVAVSSNIGTANQPSTTLNTLSGSSAGSPGANMWASAAGTPVNLAGVTVSNGAGAATVTLANVGSNTSVSTIPPVLGMTYCITVDGIYPPRP